MKPPKFIGSHGEDWCVRLAQLGPPDRIDENYIQWLIVPGPPISCHLAYATPVPSRERLESLSYYHKHPHTWSVQIVLSGKGLHFIDDKRHEVGPGSVIYQGPGVRHCIRPAPDHDLAFVNIQYPGAGHGKEEWVVCPEAGTTDHFGDLKAFEERFGKRGEDGVFGPMKVAQLFMSERWKEYFLNHGQRTDAKDK
jgi:mannose-6-phosphate isomerase-like protein (cupin superfamily)